MATGIVVGTGTNTELGRISELLGSIETLTTPLVRKMNEFARQLAVAILLISAMLFVFALFVRAPKYNYTLISHHATAISLHPQQEFPVRSNREFCYKCLRRGRLQTGQNPFSVLVAKNSLQIPAYQGLGLRPVRM